MNELELDTEQIRTEISKWMSQLFDKNVATESVKAHVTALTNKIVSTQLNGVKITISTFKDLCKVVENGF